MLKLIGSEARRLQASARERTIETCAFGLVVPAGNSPSTTTRFIVRELQEAPEDAYAVRTAVSAVLRPEYCVDISNRARAIGAGVFVAHTHPGVPALEGFSAVDDSGEELLAAYFRRRAPDAPHFSGLFTATGVYVRRLGAANLISASHVGRDLVFELPSVEHIDEKYDRQIRAFGVEGQRALGLLKIGIVGLGGTGSVVAQQLAHLGVGNFVLIDPDVLESTNLNRVVGARPNDVGTFKVRIAARHISEINPSASCVEVPKDILEESVGSLLTEVDFVFGCTDSMASRAVLNQLAYQHLVPVIDVGVGIYVGERTIQFITGRTQMLSPGLPCLVCTDKLDAEQVRREFLTEEQRKQDQYISGAAIIQPAVISLNSVMSSAAVTMFLAAVTGIPSEARMLIYDAIRGSLRPAAMEPRAHCIVCSYEGALARGRTWQLPARADSGE